jgi:hypothetical protein
MLQEAENKCTRVALLQSTEQARDLWVKSGIQWSELRPSGGDVQRFLQENVCTVSLVYQVLYSALVCYFGVGFAPGNLIGISCCVAV